MSFLLVVPRSASLTTAKSGIKTTAQFNCKIFNHNPGSKEPHLWSPNQLDHYKFSPDKYNFYADNCSFELNEEGTEYHLKCSADKKAIVDVTVSRAAPGVWAGKDGTSSFGEDPKKPWGSMRHGFWPRCTVKGSVMTQKGPVDLAGQGLFSHALQGMKPHHAGEFVSVNFL